MLNQWLRYIPVADMLKRSAHKTILEVGGGSRGIDKYLVDAAVVSVDLSPHPHTGEKERKIFPVRGSSCALPFKDNAFPSVVSIDMLEHIPPEARDTVILELLRVAKEKVYLAFPVRETYEIWEERLLKLYTAFGRKLPQWMSEHRQHGLPRREEVTRFLSANHVHYEMVPNENNPVHFIAMILDESFLSRFFIYFVDCVAPDRWVRADHSLRQNIARALFMPFRQLPRFLNFGSTVRTIFILSKK